MEDRDIAYQQNLAGLRLAWADRIASFAREAVNQAARDEEEDIHLAATEIVATRLLNSERWENVSAVDISDLAYVAVADAYGR